MAKVLTTKACAALLEDIIKKADKELYLVSFSFIISDQFFTLIKHAESRGVIVKLVYGKSIKPPFALEKLITMSNVQIYKYENLHAKIFANQDNCVVGSMNFSEASEISNYELGVKFSREKDLENFTEVFKCCKEIVAEAELEYCFDSKKEKRQLKISASHKPKLNGSCIRCGNNISYNTNKPFCISCYDSWAEWENVNYKENYCHHCGNEKQDICFVKPECHKCYNEAHSI